MTVVSYSFLCVIPFFNYFREPEAIALYILFWNSPLKNRTYSPFFIAQHKLECQPTKMSPNHLCIPIGTRVTIQRTERHRSRGRSRLTSVLTRTRKEQWDNSFNSASELFEKFKWDEQVNSGCSTYDVVPVVVWLCGRVQMNHVLIEFYLFMACFSRFSSNALCDVHVFVKVFEFPAPRLIVRRRRRRGSRWR